MSIIYTIGYEGTDIDRFVATLKAVGVQRVADVRAIPLSRKKGFSKKALASRLNSEDIEYFHFAELGDPKPGRDAARAGHYDKFRDIYSAHLDSPHAKASVKELTAVTEEKATCLLCFERDPATCHRTIIAAEITELTGFQLFELYGDDPDRYVRNTSKLPRYRPRQGAAAA